VQSQQNTKVFSKDYYRENLKKHIGKNVNIINNKTRQITNQRGTLEYVSTECFGVRIFTRNTSFIEAFSYSDLFSKNIVVDFSENPD
jgi:uncharacterized protein Veg